AEDRQSLGPPSFRGTMAGEDYRAPCGLHPLGGIREEPGAVAAELEPRRESRGAAGRTGCPAGDCLLRRLRSEDERSKSRGEGESVALVYLRARLSRRRREGLPKYDLAPGRCCRCGGLPWGRVPDQPAGGHAGVGSGGTGLDRATAAARVATGAGTL